MTLSPFFAAAPEIQVHAIAACVALLSGPVAMFRRRRDALHKGAGYLWVLAMACVALSSFLIHGFAVIGPFSPLHGLALLTLWSLWVGVRHARQGRFNAHRAVFRNLYWFGLMVAGAVNFLPGRTVNRMVFGSAEDLGWGVIAFAAMAGVYLLARRWIKAGAGAGTVPAVQH